MTTDRRARVEFDADYFARRTLSGGALPPVDAFRHAYRTNLWGGAESRSGPGSSLEQTARIREMLPELCRQLGVRTLLDLPCGDLHWMAGVSPPGVQYIGADLVPEVVARNAVLYAAPMRRFLQLDLLSSPLPAADLLLCRDCLVHLSFAHLRIAVENIRSSPITWLLTTTFTAETANRDVTTGDWRPLGLELPPFNFPAPALLVNEGCTEQDGLFTDKCLALWRIADLPTMPPP